MDARGKLDFFEIAEQAAKGGWKMGYELDSLSTAGGRILIVTATWDKAALSSLTKFFRRWVEQERVTICAFEYWEEKLVSVEWEKFGLYQVPLIIFYGDTRVERIIQGPQAHNWLIRGMEEPK